VVEQHQVVVAAAGHLEPTAAGGAVELEAGQGQGPGYHLADSRFVLEHKESLHPDYPPLLGGDPMGAVWQKI
jgi:hypothetical protein